MNFGDSPDAYVAASSSVSATFQYAASAKSPMKGAMNELAGRMPTPNLETPGELDALEVFLEASRNRRRSVDELITAITLYQVPFDTEFVDVMSESTPPALDLSVTFPDVTPKPKYQKLFVLIVPDIAIATPAVVTSVQRARTANVNGIEGERLRVR